MECKKSIDPESKRVIIACYSACDLCKTSLIHCANCGESICTQHTKEVVIDGNNQVLGVSTSPLKMGKVKYLACSKCYETVDWACR